MAKLEILSQLLSFSVVVFAVLAFTKKIIIPDQYFPLIWIVAGLSIFLNGFIIGRGVADAIWG